MEEAGVSVLWVGQHQSSPTGVAGYGLQKSEVYIGIQSLILLVNRLNNNNNYNYNHNNKRSSSYFCR